VTRGRGWLPGGSSIIGQGVADDDVSVLLRWRSGGGSDHTKHGLILLARNSGLHGWGFELPSCQTGKKEKRQVQILFFFRNPAT